MEGQRLMATQRLMGGQGLMAAQRPMEGERRSVDMYTPYTRRQHPYLSTVGRSVDKHQPLVALSTCLRVYG